MAPTITLKELVPEWLKPLTALEKKLLAAAALGVQASSVPERAEVDLDALGEAQVVRGAFLAWLLNEAACQALIHPKGVRLRGAKITGGLDLEDARVGYPLKLEACVLEGEVVLERGEFQYLALSGSRTGAIRADEIKVKHSLEMNQAFHAQGEVRLIGAEIGGQLSCRGGKFENPGGYALTCDGMVVKMDVFLNKGFEAQGEVCLLGAEIGGQLGCRGGKFENPDGKALSIQGMVVKGSVFLREGFTAQGAVRLLGAQIRGSLECDGSKFKNPGGYALSCDGMVVQGSVFLRAGFAAQGEVRLPEAQIGGQLSCSGGKFENPDGKALSIQGMVVKGGVFLNEGCVVQGRLNLTYAQVGGLVDEVASWPEPGKLVVDGLVYGPFSSRVPADAQSRLRWLALQDPGRLTVQPYEQLASVFRGMGLRDEARAVAVAKQRHIRAHLKGWSRAWSRVQDWTIGYGYYPWKVLVFILPLLALGTLVFGWAFASGVMAPTEANPHFALFAAQAQAPAAELAWDAFAYSLDVFLPIVDLHQESAWAPDMRLPGGAGVQYYLYFHILMGWVLTTLGVAGVTGLVRSD